MTLTAVSADSHVNEPPEVSPSGLPDGLRDRGPRCIDMPNGGQAWVFEDVDDPMPLGLTAVNFRSQKRFDRAGYKAKFGDEGWSAEGRPLRGHPPRLVRPEERVKEQIEDNVDGEILYNNPSVWAASSGQDKELSCLLPRLQRLDRGVQRPRPERMSARPHPLHRDRRRHRRDAPLLIDSV